jgi:hypothetical protein
LIKNSILFFYQKWPLLHSKHQVSTRISLRLSIANRPFQTQATGQSEKDERRKSSRQQELHLEAGRDCGKGRNKEQQQSVPNNQFELSGAIVSRILVLFANGNVKRQSCVYLAQAIDFERLFVVHLLYQGPVFDLF